MGSERAVVIAAIAQLGELKAEMKQAGKPVDRLDEHLAQLGKNLNRIDEGNQ